MKNKIISIFAAIALCLSLSACGNTQNAETAAAADTTAAVSETIKATEATTAAAETEAVTESVTESVTGAAQESGVKVITDREGGTIELDKELNTVVSGAPSVTEILAGLGVSNKIIAADKYSADVDGVDAAICTLDFYNFSTEELVAMAPDAVIINGISMTGENDPYAELTQAGITVLYVPSSDSIESVKADITFLAECMGVEEKGKELNAEIDACVSEITEKAAAITEKKTVYFEISAAPYMYSCGNNTFINDILKIIGAENIYASEEGWLSNSEESVIAADPDVIITSVMYDGYDYSEICARPGWEALSAVKNGNVYQVEPNPVSRPSQNVVKGIRMLAEIVYPEIYGEIANAA